MQIIKYAFQLHKDGHGELVAIEGLTDVPFLIQRIYYIYNTKTNTRRGFHAHRTLQQVLICVCGSCKVKLDDGKESQTVLLDRPDEGLYISNMIWREMFDFSPDAILLVLASSPYDETDYIRDYETFLSIANGSGDSDEK